MAPLLETGPALGYPAGPLHLICAKRPLLLGETRGIVDGLTTMTDGELAIDVGRNEKQQMKNDIMCDVGTRRTKPKIA